MTKATSHYIHGFHAVEAILKLKPQLVEQLYISNQRQDARMKTILMLAEKQRMTVNKRSREELTALSCEQHQGIVAKLTSLPRSTEKELPGILDKASASSVILVLDQVQDPHNVGACLRSANAFGADAVIAPQNQACALTPVARKAASGADMITQYIQVTNLARTLRQLKDQHYWRVGLDGLAEQSLAQTDLKGKIAFVLGSEGAGLRRLTRDECDFIVKIDMKGMIESLNVSVASAICLYAKSI